MIGLINFPKTKAVIEQGIADKWHFGAQVYISQHQRILADYAIGTKDIEAQEPMQIDSQIGWMSCSKMVAAVAIGLLYERGELDFDWTVGKIIPEFACEGKEKITFAHLLTHTCGFRDIKIRWDENSWDEAIAKICALPIEKDWILGESAGYHVATSWMILGEAIQRITGEDFADFIEEEIFEPLEMDRSFYDFPKSRYEYCKSEWAPFIDTWTTPRLQRDKFMESKNNCRPGSSCRGPIRELGTMMESLAWKENFMGVEILKPETIDQLLKPRREDKLDQTFGKVIDWTYGFMLDSKKHQKSYPYSFGPFCSEKTVGHNGNQSTAGYIDPEHGLVVCFAFNGMPGETSHQKRLEAINKAIYEDLGLGE